MSSDFRAIGVIYGEDGTRHISSADPVIAKADVALSEPEPKRLTVQQINDLPEHGENFIYSNSKWPDEITLDGDFTRTQLQQLANSVPTSRSNKTMTELSPEALAEPEPEPPGLSDEELLQIAAKTIDPYEDCGIGIDEYEAETECAVEAYGSELIAFARAQRQPEPDVDDILQLAAIIRKVDGNNSLGAAALAEEILSHPHSRWTADRAQRQPVPPVPVSEWQTGLPPSAGFYYVRGLLDESIGGDNRPVYVNPKDFVWGFWELDDPEWIGLDSSEITPENIQWKPVSLMPQPVPVSERLPGPEDCIPHPRTKLGNCCWGFGRLSTPPAGLPAAPLVGPRQWTLMYVETIELECSHWLPAHALPLPVEVEGC